MIDYRPQHIRDARRARGWSLERLGLKAGVGTTTISNIERGRPGHVHTLIALLNALNLGPELVLVRRKDEHV